MFLRINAPFPKPQAISGSRQSGFGLVELMVSISIMMLLSVIILVRNSSFNGAILLRNQAYEIAFAIRQAQLLAVSGTNGGTTVASTALVQQYGVYFNTNSSQTYFVFHDLDNDEHWDSSKDEQIGPIGHLDSRFKLRRLGNVADSYTSVSIVFRRPNFDALFENGAGNSFVGPTYIDIAQVKAAEDDIRNGAVRRVEIMDTGQISVTNYQ